MKPFIKTLLIATSAWILVLYLQSCGVSDDGNRTPLAVGENQPGVVLWQNNCNRCHNFRPQDSYDAKSWGVIARHMRIHANLTGKEISSIQEFLIGMTAAPQNTASVPVTPQATAPQSDTPIIADLEGGAAYYAARCSVCHGESGLGNGPASAALNPKPRNFQDKDFWKTANAGDMKNIILNGGPAGGKSVSMPPSPDLASQPELLEGVYQHIKSLGE